MAFLLRGTQKPPPGAMVNPEHPFGRRLLITALFHDRGEVVSLLRGTAGRVGTADPPVVLTRPGGAPAVTWGSNAAGTCASLSTTVGDFWATTSWWLPTDATTVTVIRRKQDTTARDSTLFGTDNVGLASWRYGAHVPWSDGVVYWDFGGNSGANRLTASGLSFSTTIPERWVFTAGPRGSAIWQNGVKVASQSTAITRDGGGNVGLWINNGNGQTALQPGDAVDVNYFAAYADQWSDDLCRWWSGEPYAHLYAERVRSRTIFGGNFRPAGLTTGDRALMYAQANVARSAATRAGYHDARVYVTIDGVHYATARPDATTKVLEGSLTIDRRLDFAPNTCAFTAKGFTPVVGQEVIVNLGSQNSLKHEFAGQILSLNQRYVGSPANPEYDVSAIDYTWLLNRRKVIKRYTNQSASDIAADLITSFTSGFGIRRIQASLDVLDEFTCTNQDVTEALTNLAKRIGGYWYIDYLRELRFFVGDEVGLTNPTDLIPTHPTLEAVEVTRDLSQFVTRVYHEGGGVNALTEIAPGETILPVDDAAWYESTGGTVVSGPQRITYTGVIAGGAGAIIGPGLSPSVAPTAAVKEGAGITAGSHSYAYTWVTGAGESLPSPLAGVTHNASALVESPFDPLGSTGGYTTGAPFTDGSMTPGFYGYKFTFATASSETIPDAFHLTAQLTTGASGVRIVGLPVSTRSVVTKRKIYRTTRQATMGDAQNATHHLLTTINDNTTSSGYDDRTSDASIAGGASPPTSTTLTYQAQQSSLSGVSVGPSGVTSRKVYRTAAGGSQLKLVATISDNTTTTYTDSTADGSLGANAPSTDTSGLAQPDGQVNAGSTTILTAGTGALPTSGWLVTATGALVRYTGITGNSLTGIPASGAGAILTTLSYGAPVSAAPALTGIPADGVGSIIETIKKGDPINLLVQIDDVDAQAELAGLIGGDGIQEAYLQDRRLSHTEATDRATAYLTQRNQVDVAISFVTHDVNTIPGRTLTVTLPAPTDVSGTFTVQTVQIAGFTPNILPYYRAQAAATQFSLADLLRLASTERVA